MTEQQLLNLIRSLCSCDIQMQRPEQDVINLNQWGEVNRLRPVTPGRVNYTVTLDQDAIATIADALELAP